MTLVPQVNAKVLMGDTLADRPAAASVVEDGVLFVDCQKGQLYVLRIDPITQVHVWLLIGGGGTSSVATGPSSFKFAGGFLTLSTSGESLSLADDSESNLAGDARPKTEYAVRTTTSHVAMNVEVLDDTLTTTCQVQLLKNGSVVASTAIIPGLTVAGTKFSVDAAVAFVPNDSFEVKLVKDPGGSTEQSIQVSGTLYLF